MIYLVSTALFVPLVSFLFLTFNSSKLCRTLTGRIASGAIFASFICFSLMAFSYNHLGKDPQHFTLFNWIPVHGIDAAFALTVDPLSLLMGLIITGVGFLIHVYAIGYTDHEEDFVRFFACMNFFVFSMLLLVLASNLLLLFVGWEGVGLASYLLIGYWYQRPSAAQAATKAFVVNRIGDLGLLLGILFTFSLFGTSDITEISRRAPEMFSVGASAMVVLTLLYFIGAVGKSAQLPLHTWLPDAMEGPTPVSALIHAATMVTAGVYLVVRLHTVFMLAPSTLHFIGAVGGATSLFAALCAVGQTDLKRVLAYSTVSQLGLMFLACGIGAFYAAMFHLTTHAFVKALLFLSAGNVVHMLHGNTQMATMGGLSKVFTKTHWLFLIGVLAMSGIPPLSAFFSKDLILEQEHLAGFDTLFVVGMTTSLLTGFYLTRAYCLTFLGKSRAPSHEHPQEAPYIMLIPVSILAFLATFGGSLGFAFGKHPELECFLNSVGVTLAQTEEGNAFLYTSETFFSIVGAIAAVSLAAFIYLKYPERIYTPVPYLRNSFYIDDLYAVIFVNPLKALSNAIANFIDPRLFQGFVNGLTNSTQTVAVQLQKLQSGQIRSYVAWMTLGTVIILVYFVL